MTALRASFLIVLFGFGFSAQAVSISEVAWMGSSTSANHEWIELFNSGSAVNVDGWTLTDGMNLTISLMGTIPSNSYIVLERNRSDGNSVVGVPFLNYAGALVNTGATLTLRRGDGSVVDQVVGGENWQNIGGDNTTKETAQYTSSGWVTAKPTPGAPNSTISVSQNTSASGQSTTAASTVLTGTVVTTESARASYAHLPWVLDLAIVGPATVQVNQPVTYRANASGLGPTHLNSLAYSWNLGDLTTAGTDEVMHSYQYPGTYIITLYATFAKREAIATKSVTVLPVQFSLARVNGGDLQLYNDATYDVDISGFSLKSGGKTIVFPPRSYLSARSTLTIPVSRIGNPHPVILYDQAGNQLASTVSQPAASHTSSPSPSPSPSTFAPLIQVPDPTSVPVITTTNPAFRFATDEPLSVNATEDAISSDAISLTPDDFISLELEESELLAGESSSNQSATWPYGLLVVVMGISIFALIAFPRQTT